MFIFYAFLTSFSKKQKLDSPRRSHRAIEYFKVTRWHTVDHSNEQPVASQDINNDTDSLLSNNGIDMDDSVREEGLEDEVIAELLPANANVSIQSSECKVSFLTSPLQVSWFTNFLQWFWETILIPLFYSAVASNGTRLPTTTSQDSATANLRCVICQDHLGSHRPRHAF